MAKVLMFKAPFETKHFNANQKLWVIETTGAMAAKVCGKFRGNGRYTEAWVSWDRADRDKYPIPEIKEIEIDDSFAERHGIKKI